MEFVFSSLNNQEKKFLLETLGYKLNEAHYIVNAETGQLHKCPITRKAVKFEDASIFPGSTLVINTNAMTLSEYIYRYLDVNVE